MTALTANSEMFLQLLTTQLKNQSPLDPMDPTEFTNQLATYSALEQQIQTNDSLTSVISQLSALTSVSALSYLGTTAELDSNIGVMQAGVANWTYTLPANAKTVSLRVTDGDGAVVFESAGDTASGIHAFGLTSDQLSAAVADGDPLVLTVTAVGTDGSTLAVETSSLAQITAINGLREDAAYQAGNVSFASADIIRIRSSVAN